MIVLDDSTQGRAAFFSDTRTRLTLGSRVVLLGKIPGLVMPTLEYLRSEIERMRTQIGRQRKEILQLQRAGIGTASAEALLTRMQAKVEQLVAQRDEVKMAEPRETRTRVLGGGGFGRRGRDQT